MWFRSREYYRVDSVTDMGKISFFGVPNVIAISKDGSHLGYKEQSRAFTVSTDQFSFPSEKIALIPIGFEFE